MAERLIFFKNSAAAAAVVRESRARKRLSSKGQLSCKTLVDVVGDNFLHYLLHPRWFAGRFRYFSFGWQHINMGTPLRDDQPIHEFDLRFGSQRSACLLYRASVVSDLSNFSLVVRWEDLSLAGFGSSTGFLRLWTKNRRFACWRHSIEVFRSYSSTIELNGASFLTLASSWIAIDSKEAQDVQKCSKVPNNDNVIFTDVIVCKLG